MKLSVSLVTFQELDYVQQALEGALRQKTNFPFEIIVGDDASTDGSQDILRQMAADNPEQIKLLLASENYGDYGLSNFMSTIDNCTGEYVAFLDGDDYWTSPDKLQRQVDFLDAHPECALCAHRVVHASDDGVQELSALPLGSKNVESVHDVGELLIENFAPKISTVARRDAIDTVPDWYRTTRVASADWVFNVLVSRHGKIGYIDEVMAVHRKRVGSLTAFYGTSRLLVDKLSALEVLSEYLPDHGQSLEIAANRIRWKLRVSRMGPKAYKYARRLYYHGRSAL